MRFRKHITPTVCEDVGEWKGEEGESGGRRRGRVEGGG